MRWCTRDYMQKDKMLSVEWGIGLITGWWGFSLASTLPLCTVENINSLEAYSSPPNWNTWFGGRSFIDFSITYCMIMEVIKFMWHIMYHSGYSIFHIWHNCLEIKMRGGPNSNRWWWSWQKLSLHRGNRSTRLVKWEQWDQQTSERKVQCLDRMMKWCDITIKERLLQIPKKQSPGGTLKNTG